MEWYEISNIDELDTPALVLYPERIAENIRQALWMVGDPDKLRPHVKTNKMAEVCRMMMEAGIRKFKCATIAEAEMLAMSRAEDVLLAYQPVGPKVKRLLALKQKYPATSFGCLVDNAGTAARLSDAFETAGLTIPVYIDLNNGMNRSGIQLPGAMDLYKELLSMKGLEFAGLHVYDGHLRDTDPKVRQEKSDQGFQEISMLRERIEKASGKKIRVVAGGSPSFPTHTHRPVECSPGTFVFWDWGYGQILSDEPFEFAALVVTRVISVIDRNTITTDLGHKSIAAENPFPRVHFLNAPDVSPIGQSEEHLVLKVPDSGDYEVGDVLYGVPVHICPTVALYDSAAVVRDHRVAEAWPVVARDRAITV